MQRPVRASRHASAAPAGAGRGTPLGTDVAFNVETPDGSDLAFSFWDLWMILASREEPGASLEALATRLRAERNSVSFLRHDAKPKLSHVRGLQRRLRNAGLGEEAALSAAGDLGGKEGKRATAKVLRKEIGRHEWSQDMKVTPEVRGLEHALCGYWPRFPVIPRGVPSVAL